MAHCIALGCGAAIGRSVLCVSCWARLPQDEHRALDLILAGPWPGAMHYWSALFGAVVTLARLDGLDPTQSPLYETAKPHLAELERLRRLSEAA